MHAIQCLLLIAWLLLSSDPSFFSLWVRSGLSRAMRVLLRRDVGKASLLQRLDEPGRGKGVGQNFPLTVLRPRLCMTAYAVLKS
jgi:hypothetical protein